jgi:transcriptional regulator with XRE-family HTH domain
LNEDLFRERLQKLREERRKSRVVVSQLCGLQNDAVRRYERGESKPSMEALVALADFFEVSLDYLTGRANYR